MLEKNNSQSTPQKTTIDLRKNTTTFKIVEKIIPDKKSGEQTQKNSFEGSLNFQNSPANKNARQAQDENKLLIQ